MFLEPSQVLSLSGIQGGSGQFQQQRLPQNFISFGMSGSEQVTAGSVAGAVAANVVVAAAPNDRASGSSTIQAQDPNSPELFKQSLARSQAEVLRLQNLARKALSGIENAYHPGYTPESTAQILSQLKSAIAALVQLLRTTGVGALPLLPPAPVNIHQQQPSPLHQQQGAVASRVPPTEAELLVSAEQHVKDLYEAMHRKQENAAVVVNLLPGPLALSGENSFSQSQQRK